jgi:hypothetical protein
MSRILRFGGWRLLPMVEVSEREDEMRFTVVGQNGTRTRLSRKKLLFHAKTA